MKVLVCGATGCIGSAVVKALHSRGHHVVMGARGAAETSHAMALDFMQPTPPERWAERLSQRGIEAVVNCVGILMESAGQHFDRVHAAGPKELFQGAARAGLRRIVQISALGVSTQAERVALPYLRSKLLADEALAALPLDGVVLRPSLVYGPGSQSAALFATLSALPVIGLPGRGQQMLQPIHVYEVAEIVARLIEAPTAVRGICEIGGDKPISWREMLAGYRAALHLGEALWLPLPLPLMQAGAWFAEALPQRVYCRDTLRMLQFGNVASPNAAATLLGRAPSSLAQGLRITPPSPWIDLSARLSPALDRALRFALAFMWIYTALVSLLLRDASGVMALLARCGFTGDAGLAALLASCTLNLALGVFTLWRPTPLLYALQCAAIVGYTVTAALHMPELTIDHCGPLTKNLPLLAAVLVAWLAHGSSTAAAQPSRRARGGGTIAA